MNQLADKLKPRHTRRLLAIDGGGVKAGFSVGVLSRIEQTLRSKSGNPELVLADYFDYIAGTSIGAVLAAGLSLGMSMEEVRQFSRASVKDFFRPAGILSRFRFKYSAQGIGQRLTELFGDMDLGSPRLRTLLLLVLRNASTDSAWPVSNNPRAVYNAPERPDCNLRLRLAQLLRGSTAAPTYFPPERIQLAARDFVFVDGGITIANNPAFQLFLQATLPGYRLDWPTGADRLLLVSVGTGHVPARNTAGHSVVFNAVGTIRSLLSATAKEQDLLCQLFGKCLVGDALDREIGNLGNVDLPWPKLFTYCRYNLDLTREAFDTIGIRQPPERYHTLDRLNVFDELIEVGERVAATQVESPHFSGFDVQPPSA